jgi:hypothetical protein
MQPVAGCFEVAHSSKALYDSMSKGKFAEKIRFSAKKSKPYVSISRG